MLSFNRIALQLDAPFQKQLTHNAPVTRVSWSSSNLPDGLTLSQSGLIEGHPTNTGTFDCSVTVSTNWGNNTKNLRIVIL